jgi:hypothetical protein
MTNNSFGCLSGPLARSAVAMATMIVAMGCGDGRPTRWPVTGSVRINGRPAEGALVVLHPVPGTVVAEAEKVRPTGSCDRDGNFVIGTWQQADGVPAGRWKATVEWFLSADMAEEADPETARSEQDRLGGAYADPEETPLTVDVTNSAVQLPSFELRAAATAARSPEGF